MTTVGTGGCGYEQQLEAILKALSPFESISPVAADYTRPTFFANRPPHGDASNAGLHRDHSVLAIVLLTDEEDCSAADPEIFNPASVQYGSVVFNLRCYRHPNALYPVTRYVAGFEQLRADPRRVVFMPIVGVPSDLVPSEPGASPNWSLLIGDEDSERDSRLVEQEDTTTHPPNSLAPSCSVPGVGRAFPPIRIVNAAFGLSRTGAHVDVQSICQESFRGPVDRLIYQLVEAGGRRSAP